MASGKGGGSKGGSSKASTPVAQVRQTSNSNNPSAGTRTVTPINGATQAQANKAVAKSEQAAKPKANLANAGPVLSRKEAEAIADRKGQSVAQVMAAAQGKGIGFTAGLVNNFNSGNLGPNGSNLSMVMGKIPVAPGQGRGTTQALQSLQALQGLRMQPKTVYAGYSTTNTPGQSHWDPLGGSSYTPGRTTYNPIVVPKGFGGAAAARNGGNGNGGAGGGNGGGNGAEVKNDGSFDSIKALYQQQFDTAMEEINRYKTEQAKNIETLQLDFADQIAQAGNANDQQINYLSTLLQQQQEQALGTQNLMREQMQAQQTAFNQQMMQQQLQSSSTIDLLNQQNQAAQAAYLEQVRQTNALGRAYVPGLEQTAASVQLGDQRSSQRQAANNSLSSLAIASPSLGANLNPLAGLQLA